VVVPTDGAAVAIAAILAAGFAPCDVVGSDRGEFPPGPSPGPGMKVVVDGESVAASPNTMLALETLMTVSYAILLELDCLQPHVPSS
jgi:hypothetical protein